MSNSADATIARLLTWAQALIANPQAAPSQASLNKARALVDLHTAGDRAALMGFILNNF